MTKSNKRDELVDALIRWAEEDKENRSVLVLADDERSTRSACNGTGVNIANVLANAMLNDRRLYSLYATAMLIYKENKANDDDEAETNND